MSASARSTLDRQSVKDARAEVALAPGKITSLSSRARSWRRPAANLTLERAPGGANLAGDLRINGINLRQKRGGRARPRILRARHARCAGPVASGKGELKLGDITMHAPTPLAVVATSDAVLSGDAGGTGEQLTAALRTQIDASAVAVGPRTIPIAIADGAAKLALVTLESEAGPTKVETTVDLASLVVDSAWLAEPKAPDVAQAARPRGGALPSVGVVYTGPLRMPGRLNRVSPPSRWSVSSPSAGWSSTPISSSGCTRPTPSARAATKSAAARSSPTRRACSQPPQLPVPVPPPAAVPSTPVPFVPQPYGCGRTLPPLPNPASAPASAQPSRPNLSAQPRQCAGRHRASAAPGQRRHESRPFRATSSRAVGASAAAGSRRRGTRAPNGNYRQRRSRGRFRSASKCCAICRTPN